MTERKLYGATFGPYVYLDDDSVSDPDGDFANFTEHASISDGGHLCAFMNLLDTDQTHGLKIYWNEDDSAHRVLDLKVQSGDRTLNLGGDFVINADFTVAAGFGITLQSLGQANQLTLNEDFTIGNGSAGTLTFSAAVALTVEAASYVNQDLTSDAAPTFGGLTKVGGASDYVQVETDGDVLFVGGGGLHFSEVYGYDQNQSHAFGGSGIANKVQVIAFAANGETNGDVTPDHTNDHITIGKAGRYLVTISMTAESGAGAGFELGAGLWVNNGGTQKSNVHAHRWLTGGGGDTGSISMSGIVDFAASDTVEVWVYNETNTTSVVVDDITMSIVQIGGTT